METGPALAEPTVDTQLRSGHDRRHAARRRQPRAQGERRRGDRRRASALATLLAGVMGLMAHGRLHHQFPDLVAPALEFFSAPDPPAPEASPAPPLSPYERFIAEASDLYGVSADLVRAVIQTESNFNPRAASRAGAQGLMQLTPVTLRELKMKIDPFDPRENILAGTKYLSMMLDRHDGDVPLALASYNAGPTAVRRHHGIPPFGETRGYVRKVQDRMAEVHEAATTADATLAD